MNESRFFCIVWFGALLLVTCKFSVPIAADDRPNVLFLFSDDQRADTIAARGNQLIQTPNIDRIVRAGTYFERAYCMGSIHGAVCVPSRAMLMSGKTLYNTSMQLRQQTTMPQLLGQAGYTTFGTGKWHNGKESFARSFQHGQTIMFGGMSDHTKVPLHDMNPNLSFSDQRTGDGFSSTMFADAAIEFLEQHDTSARFFCYVAFSAPHDPRMPPTPYDEMYRGDLPALPANFLPHHSFNTGTMKIRDEVLGAYPRTEQIVRQQLADYYGMISHMDDQIGRILKVLEQRGLLDNTMIVFAADHGLGMGSHGLLGKQNLYEHSMKSPVAISGPNIPAGVTNRELVYIHDLNPTVCQYAGIEIPEDVEGISLKPVIEGHVSNIRSSLFTTYASLIRAVRDDRWKLVRWPQVDKTQLFDLQNDPHELKNLVDDPTQQQRVLRMTMLLADWQKRVNDRQPLIADKPIPLQIDLTFQRQADRWQPQWIVDKYFDGVQQQPEKK